MKRYNIIYADPPWSYRQKKLQGSAEKHYKTMTKEEICSLPVSDLADTDCALFLWATFPQLKEALCVIDAWGFKYMTVAFVWIKKNKKADSLFWGLGFWTRSNAEICLLGIKGKPKRRSAKIHQVITSRIREHSRKPDEAREKIVDLMGDLPRIELFAREKVQGWDAWGNEVECDISMEGGENHVGQLDRPEYSECP